MQCCVFLTMDHPGSFVTDDHLVVEPLNRLGRQVQFVPWKRRGVDWREFEAVVIRSTWDYQNEPGRFIESLEEIESTGVPLFNSLELVRWNLEKTYLRQLHQAGVPVIPTLFAPDANAVALEDLYARLDCDAIILKPQIGANSDAIQLLRRAEPTLLQAEKLNSFVHRSFLAQPFRQSIVEEGEYSLFFFAGLYSHCILKRPAPSDFRSQEEHGATICPVQAPLDLVELSRRLHEALPSEPLYARADFIRSPSGAFEVMEVEVIEPALYFRTDDGAPFRFAEALVRKLESEGAAERAG